MKFKVIFTVMICLSLVVSCKSTKQTTTPTLLKEPDFSVLDNSLKQIEEFEKQIEEFEKHIEEFEKHIEADSTAKVTVLTESVKPVDKNETTMYGYYVIIGSFRNISNARQQNANLVKEGFSPTILENENGLFRISAGGYNEENAARSRIAEIRTQYANHKGVWLLIRK